MANRGNVELLLAGVDQRTVLANLFELYSHDFCDFLDLQIGPTGRFGCDGLDLYWSEPGRFPFLVYVENRLAGFVLLKRIEREMLGIWDLAEFFILRSHRRRGIGTAVARRVFERFEGPWEVRVRESNPPARSFWEHAIALFRSDFVSSKRIDENSVLWHVFSFDSRGSRWTDFPETP